MFISPHKKLFLSSGCIALVIVLIMVAQSRIAAFNIIDLPMNWLAKTAAGNALIHSLNAPEKYQTSTSSLLWSADHETGDFSQWEAKQGRAIYNSNTAPGTSNISISTDVARSGQHALKLRLTDARNGQTQGARIFRRWLDNDIFPAAPLPDEAYYAAWFYFPQAYAPEMWWNIFQFKSRGNQSQPMFSLNVAQGRTGDMYLYMWDNILEQSYGQDTGVVYIPIGRWVHIEAYLRTRHTPTGRLTIWQDGVQIIDLVNIQTLVNQDDRLHWSINNYTDGIVPSDPTIYVDDAAISTTRISQQVMPDSAKIYVGANSGGVVGGVGYSDEDILLYDATTDSWSLVFDGSDVGMGTDLAGFHLEADGTILMSIELDWMLPGITAPVEKGDIVRFMPTTLGGNTTGTFDLVLDGSDVGLAGVAESIDAIGRTPDGRLVVSTAGDYDTPDGSGGDEDLLVFNATSFGAATSGSWQRYFDGSDLGLHAANEDIRSTWIDPATGHIHLSTYGDFETASGFRGDANDIFTCIPSRLGGDTRCSFSRFWNGDDYGFSTKLIDGLALASAASAPFVADTRMAAAGELGPHGTMPDETLPSDADDAEDELPRQLYLPDIRH